MNQRSDRGRYDDKWLEKSLVAPEPHLIFERSDGEMAASQELIHEKAKTERWNRGVTRVLYTIELAVILLPSGIFIGMLVGTMFCTKCV